MWMWHSVICVLVFFCCNQSVCKLQAPGGSGGFMGCVRDLTLNEAPVEIPAYSQGTVPCFQNTLQPGAYFSGQGGHMAIGSSHWPPFMLCLLVWALPVLTDSSASPPYRWLFGSGRGSRDPTGSSTRLWLWIAAACWDITWPAPDFGPQAGRGQGVCNLFNRNTAKKYCEGRWITKSEHNVCLCV